ncbi:MAG: hypothetical protein MEQ74_14710 [Paracoccus sp.]|nr:hypothetical protein [Paracoccus sp. (in: a-proteobacteria)]
MGRAPRYPALRKDRQEPLRVRHELQACGDQAPPLFALRMRVLVGLSQIIWTVFGEDANEKFGLSAILLGLHPIPAVVSPAGNHQLVNRETLGLRDLHKDT